VSAPGEAIFYVASTTPFVREVKQLPIMAILIYAFFKFARAFRLWQGDQRRVILILARRDFFSRSLRLISDRARA
jgi:uncharacterized membrane protein